MIKLFEDFNEYSQVKSWLDKMYITGYTINDDLTVDVDRDVHINQKDLINIPIQFGKVAGTFNCYHNLLTSLKGCPMYVGGAFYCNDNKLTSLEYAPTHIDGNFNCKENELITLKGCPKKIQGAFNCSHNKLTSLEYFPGEIAGEIYCGNNSLTTLKYAPKEINDYFGVGNNPLPSKILPWLDNASLKKILFKHQEEYGIWNDDGSFNKGRWNIFVKDYNNNIL